MMLWSWVLRYIKKRQLMRRFFWILIVGTAAYFYLYGCEQTKVEPELVDRVRRHYGSEIESICEEEGLDPDYFKALAILEVSARKNPPSRTEKIIWEQLKAVQKGEREKYSFFTTEDLRHRSNTDLKFMATSWGPFQIMGFHAVKLGFPLQNLRNEHALRTGIRWCKENYGDYLEKKDYRNAFHIHNTGRPYPAVGNPLTSDPKYVEKGLKYMKLLKKPLAPESPKL